MRKHYSEDTDLDLLDIDIPLGELKNEPTPPLQQNSRQWQDKVESAAYTAAKASTMPIQVIKRAEIDLDRLEASALKLNDDLADLWVSVPKKQIANKLRIADRRIKSMELVRRLGYSALAKSVVAAKAHPDIESKKENWAEELKNLVCDEVAMRKVIEDITDEENQ